MKYAWSGRGASERFSATLAIDAALLPLRAPEALYYAVRKMVCECQKRQFMYVPRAASLTIRPKSALALGYWQR
jgi:hypothetical protein